MKDTNKQVFAKLEVGHSRQIHSVCDKKGFDIWRTGKESVIWNVVYKEYNVVGLER